MNTFEFEFFLPFFIVATLALWVFSAKFYLKKSSIILYGFIIGTVVSGIHAYSFWIISYNSFLEMNSSGEPCKLICSDEAVFQFSLLVFVRDMIISLFGMAIGYATYLLYRKILHKK